MSDYIEEIKALAQGEREYLVGLRRDLHAHPELGLREFRTAEVVERELEGLGIEHRRVGETGVLGVLRGRSAGERPRTVLLRADMDALPIRERNACGYASKNDGVMHACGHDAHTACLLGAAKILARLRELRQDFDVEVRLAFQQAEEIGAGARIFLADDTIMRGVDRVFGLHVAPDLAAGTVGIKPGINNAAVDYFKIQISGKSTHVSTPHLGTDALYIASQVVVAVQAAVSRLSSPVEPVLIGIGKMAAGTAYNAVAESAVLEGTTRTLSLASRQKIKKHVTEIAQGTAAIYGGKAALDWQEFTSPLINDATACGEMCAAASAVFGADNIVRGREVSLGGDDMAEFLLAAPGAYAYLGTANSQQPGTQNQIHTVNFDIDEDVLPLGAALLSGACAACLPQGQRHDAQAKPEA